MNTLTVVFRQLWERATDQEQYDKEAREVGATLAGIKMQERITAFSLYCIDNGAKIIDALERDDQASVARAVP